MHALTYRDSARDDYYDVLSRLEALAAHEHIRFSGRDEVIVEKLWCAISQSYHFERLQPESDIGMRAWKIAEDIVRELPPKLMQIKKDSLEIEEILSGFGYGRRVLTKEKRNMYVYVRQTGTLIDVVTDYDPSTSQWDLQHYQMSKKEYAAWCETIFTEGSALRKHISRLHYLKDTSKQAINGGLSAAILSIFTFVPLMLMFEPLTVQLILGGIAGAGCITGGVDGYKNARVEHRINVFLNALPELQERHCLVVGGR